jgi:hypothetical protein
MKSTRLERDFQADLIKELREMFPGCYLQKNNPNHQQGIPDLLILWNDRWAVLEVKKSDNETPRPNQPYFVDEFNKMSFASFIYPENKEEVLHALAEAFGVGR